MSTVEVLRQEIGAVLQLHNGRHQLFTKGPYTLVQEGDNTKVKAIATIAEFTASHGEEGGKFRTITKEKAKHNGEYLLLSISQAPTILESLAVAVDHIENIEVLTAIRNAVTGQA